MLAGSKLLRGCHRRGHSVLSKEIVFLFFVCFFANCKVPVCFVMIGLARRDPKTLAVGRKGCTKFGSFEALV